jgi:putative oxidoreductase
MDTLYGHAAPGAMDDIGKLVLRLALGLLILFHGISKLTGGIEPIAGMLTGIGAPGAFAYLVYIGEVLAPLMLLLGVWTRLAAVVIAINMAVAVLLVHTSQFFTLAKTGGWALELQGMYFIAAVAIALLGPGRYRLAGRANR